MKLQSIIIFAISISLQCGNSGQSTKEVNVHIDPGSDSLFYAELNQNRQWSSFRGHYARGFLDNAELPDHWNVETMENIRWKIPIPGLGLSCPVIWEDHVFITTAVSESDEEGIRTGIYGDGEPVDDESIHHWMVFAIDKSSGEIRWERTAHTGIPEVKRHPKSSHANPTIATDGQYVIAFFGSEGIYCYDFDGNLIWERDFGVLMASAHGVDWAEWEFASSPIIHKDRVIIQADVKENSFLAALDLPSGEIIWKTERKDWPGWSTPNIYYHQGEPRIAVNGYKHRGGYDFMSGDEVWKMSGGGDVPVPTPVLYRDMIFFNSAHGKENPILAVRTGASGHIAYPKSDRMDDAVAWFKERAGSYLQTLLVYRDLLYNLRWNGNLVCFDAATGDQNYRETVDTESFIASPVAADGKVYLVSEAGEVYIVEAGPQYRLIQSFPLGEITLATPAISEGLIVFRTTGHLIGISKTD